MPAQKILFFSPYAYVNVWAYPEAIIAENFRRRGHEIFQVRCRGLYSAHCIAMSAINLTPSASEAERKAVCDECIARNQVIRSRFEFNTLFVDDYISDETLERVEARTEQVKPSNWLEIEFDGIPVARYASYEHILNAKINKTEFDQKQWEAFIVHLKNALLTLEAGRKIIDEVQPDALLSYNMWYSCNHVMCDLAGQRGIAFYTEHQGAHHRYRQSEMTIMRGGDQFCPVARSTAWQKLRDRPLSAPDIALAFDHVEELLDATSPWVYSTKSELRGPDELRALFSIDRKQKVLLVTMSSGDERFAAELVGALPPYRSPLFSSQIDWVKAVIEWVAQRQDLFLIIRVHPREFPNKREQVLSRQAQNLREIFVDLPGNCRVNWPDDALSLHDIAKITDVGLNATSTAGLELLLFGIPVVIYDSIQFYAYPAELNLSATSKDDYWTKIESALTQGRSTRQIVGAFRWLAFKSTVMSIDISDVYGPHFEKGTPPTVGQPTIFSRLKSRLLGRQAKSKESNPPVDDPFMNFDGLSHIKSSRWLAYAVENRASNHLDALADEMIRDTPASAEEELKLVTAAAKKYFAITGARPIGLLEPASVC